MTRMNWDRVRAEKLMAEAAREDRLAAAERKDPGQNRITFTTRKPERRRRERRRRAGRRSGPVERASRTQQRIMTLRAEVMSARLAGDRRVTERLARQGLRLITYAGSENIKSDRMFFRDALEWAVPSNSARRTKQEDRAKAGSRRLERKLLPGPGGPKRKPAPPTPAAKLKRDTALVSLLRNAVDAASDEDGWAALGSVGQIITKQRPEFDSRNYGYSKLSELIAATTLFVLDRRGPGDGKGNTIYVRDKRHHDGKPGS